MRLDLTKLNQILITVSTNKWLLISLTVCTLSFFATKLFGPAKVDAEAVRVLKKQNDQCSTEKQQFVDYILKMNNSLKEITGAQSTSFAGQNYYIMFAVYDTIKRPLSKNQQQQLLMRVIISNDSVIRRFRFDSLKRADSIKKRS